MPVNPNRGAIGRAAAIATASAAFVLLLAACVPAEPAVVMPSTSTTTASPAPAFASDAEALAAAEEAYAAYRLATDLIAQDGGSDPTRIEQYVTAEQYTREIEAFATIAENGLRQIGSVEVRGAVLQAQDEGTGTVEAYFCLDYSMARFVNRDGGDVQTGRTSDYLKVLVVFERDLRHVLVVESSEPWGEVADC